MAFQSKFKNNEKLRLCAVRDPDHVGEIFAPTGPHVGLIQEALNAWAARQVPPIPPINGTEAAPPFKYGKATGDMVALYKTRQTPPILNYKGQIDRIVGIKTVAALDKELPPNGSSVGPEMQIVNAADVRRLAALTKAELELRRLKKEFEPGVPDPNDRVVQALQRQLFVQMDSSFWDVVNKLLALIQSNKLTAAPFQIDKSKNEFAHVDPSLEAVKGVTFCKAFFETANDNCRQEVATHEFFHLVVGAGHFYETKINSEAMRCPHHLARFVFDVAVGQQVAPCSQTAGVCK